MQRILPGVEVEHAGQRWRVRRVLGPDAVLLDNANGQVLSANPVGVTVISNEEPAFPDRVVDDQRYTSSQWAEAERRRDIVSALAKLPIRSGAAVDAAAKELGVKRRRLWDVLKLAEITGFEIAAFLPRTGAPRSKRLNGDVEAIIKQAIDQFYATPSRPKLSSLHDEIDRRCRSASLSPPSYRAVKAQVEARDQIWLTRKRKGPKEARSLRLLTGSHPGAIAPWERVQIDSTPCDVLLVREMDRAIIGRATGTFAIDIYSRAILGFSVSLQSASTLTVATCLEHACLPKDSWLAQRGLERLRWPIYGKPVTLEYDQGSENEALGIQRGLRLNSIKSKVRKKGHPEHHGHIERVIGTMMKELHELPGTTFSNIDERGESEPDKLACLTLPDLEAILAISIDTYNHSTHSATGERPIDRYLSYYRQPNLPDAERIPSTMHADCLLDFLPFESRELRRTGIRLFWVDYSSVDILPLWQRDNQKALKRVVVYDPRSLKNVWVVDEMAHEYIKVPYRIPHPDMTLAESIQARENSRHLKSRDRTEARLFENIAAIQEIVAKAKSTTTRRKAERAVQARRSLHQKDEQRNVVEETSSQIIMREQPAWVGTEITPFSDVERI